MASSTAITTRSSWASSTIWRASTEATTAPMASDASGDGEDLEAQAADAAEPGRSARPPA